MVRSEALDRNFYFNIQGAEQATRFLTALEAHDIKMVLHTALCPLMCEPPVDSRLLRACPFRVLPGMQHILTWAGAIPIHPFAEEYI